MNNSFYQFYLALTNRCNLECIMCSTTRHPHEFEQELSLREWMNVLENITRFRIDVISFGGGEPFLRENDLFELISFAVSKRIKINVVTNATLLTHQFLEKAKSMKDYLIFVVSCDGMEPENDYIRGKGTFKRIFNSVNMIKDSGFTVYISSVIMPENFANFNNYLEFIKANYADTPIDIQPVIPHNEIYYRRSMFNLTDSQLSHLQGVVDFLHRNNTVKLCRPLTIIDKYMDYFKGKLQNQNQCKMGTDSFNINLRGNIWVCGKEIEYPLHKNKLEDVLSSREYLVEMERVRSCKSPCLAGLVI